MPRLAHRCHVRGSPSPRPSLLELRPGEACSVGGRARVVGPAPRLGGLGLLSHPFTDENLSLILGTGRSGPGPEPWLWGSPRRRELVPWPTDYSHSGVRLEEAGAAHQQVGRALVSSRVSRNQENRTPGCA